jgi:colicin import membrane protein
MNAPTASDLITLDTIKAEELFAPGGVDKVLINVKERVTALNTFDPTTKDGRDAIKSLAYKIARTKTGLDDLGKEHVAELKRQAGIIDADRKTLRDTLDKLRDDVRKPVDDWEAGEQERIDRQAAALDVLSKIAQFDGPEPSLDEIDSAILALQGIGELVWDEDFAERAAQLKERARITLTTMRDATVRRAAEREELERLRAAEAERQREVEAAAAAETQRKRDEEIAALAAAAAKAEKEAAERALAESEQRAREAAEDASRKLAAIEAQRQAEREAEAERLRVAQEAAAAAERQRIADAEAAEAEAARRREENTRHKKKINNAAAGALVNHGGLSEDAAKAAIVAIALKQVPNVTITY